MTLAFDIADSPSSIPSSSGRSATQGLTKELASATSAYRHRLILRFAVINLAAFALLAAAWFQGWVQEIIRTDDSGLSIVIFIVFLVGLGACARQIWIVTQQMNDFDAIAHHGAAPMAESWTAAHLEAVRGQDAGTRDIAARSLTSRIRRSIGFIHQVSGSLVLLGLIGTVIGFVMALGGVDPRHVADAASIAPMVATLISGMSVALYTTLVGSILNVWLDVAFRMLTGAAGRLSDDIVALGESHVRG